jgi:hypothetical protein
MVKTLLSAKDAKKREEDLSGFPSRHFASFADEKNHFKAASAAA